MVDSFEIAKNIPCESQIVTQLLNDQYFVFVLHRQENVSNDELIRLMMGYLEVAAEVRKCVIILHKITEIKLEEMGILAKLRASSSFFLIPRVDYFDFMKLLGNAEFVVTDGGSNQEELSYMGKPTLVIRDATEREEGIGANIVLYEGKKERIERFFLNMEKERCGAVR